MVNMDKIELIDPKHSVVSPNYEKAIVVNRIACGDARDQKDNLDRDFGKVW